MGSTLQPCPFSLLPTLDCPCCRNGVGMMETTVGSTPSLGRKPLISIVGEGAVSLTLLPPHLRSGCSSFIYAILFPGVSRTHAPSGDISLRINLNWLLHSGSSTQIFFLLFWQCLSGHNLHFRGCVMVLRCMDRDVEQAQAIQEPRAEECHDNIPIPYLSYVLSGLFWHAGNE